MRKASYLFIMFLFMVLLSGCDKTNQKDYGKEYIPGYDAQNFAIYESSAAYTEGGFYAINDYTEHIEYIDSATKESVSLCAKPDCNHDNENCNAYFCFPRNLNLYNGYLYLIVNDFIDTYSYSLYRVSLDGSERKEIGTIYRTDEEDAACSSMFFTHRGYGYLLINWVFNDNLNQRSQCMYRVNMETAEKEVVYEVTGYNPQIYPMLVEGNYIYLSVDLQDSNNELVSNIIRYDIRNKNTEELYKPDGHIFLSVHDDITYTMCSNQISGKDIYSVYDENNIEMLYSYDSEMPFIYRDTEYLYWDNYMGNEDNGNRKVSIYDYDGNLVSEVLDVNGNVKWSNGKQLLTYSVKDEKYLLYDFK